MDNSRTVSDASSSAPGVGAVQPAMSHCALSGFSEYWPMAAALAIYAGFALYDLGQPSLFADEGRFGVSALNILHSLRQLALVSERPLGGVGTKPYLYPLELALSILAFGRTAFALRVVNAVGLVFASLCLGRAVRELTGDRLVASLAAALFLLNPWTITYARVAIPDTGVVIWGCVGLLAAVYFFKTLRYRWAAVAGATIGLGFLSKMWLVFPFVLACAALILARYPTLHKKVVLPALAAGSAFLIVAASHLLLAIWLAPSGLPQWLHVYFGFSLGSRWNGPGFDPAIWYRPWWFYLFQVFRATFFGLPFLILGVQSLARRRDFRTMALLSVLLLPLPVLSIFLVKQTSYIYSVCPSLAILMAYGAARWLRDPDRRSILIPVGISALAAAVVGGAGLLPVTQLASIFALYLTYGLGAVLSTRGGKRAIAVCLALVAVAMLTADGLVVRTSLARKSDYREVATYFRNSVARLPIRQTAFVAPEFPAFEFYLFRRGEYWKTWYRDTSARQVARGCRQGSLVFFVEDPEGKLYGGEPTPSQRRALTGCATDVTRRIDLSSRRQIPLRVFASTGRTD